MEKERDSFGATFGGSLGNEMAKRAVGGADRRLRPKWLLKQKKKLVEDVSLRANMPSGIYHRQIVSSALFEGLRKNYINVCKGYVGGLLIVYDKQGTGKSYALQAVARAQSSIQPPRFLCINIMKQGSCQFLYNEIKKRVLGDVQDFDITPDELAEVIKYGLCGPPLEDGKPETKLPDTSNSCRISIDSPVVNHEKTNNFPILVIDEIVPDNFKWDKDYSLQQLRESIGDLFEFFNALTGEAHQGNGFVVFLGTKSEAFARAIHKINGGTKASLARYTTTEKPQKDADGDYPFEIWRGIPWTARDKAQVVRGLFERPLKRALRGQDLDEVEVDVRANEIIERVCSDNRKNIREIVLVDMPEALTAEEVQWRALQQSRSQPSPVAGCLAGVKDMFAFLGFDKDKV